ncbi:MAG: hypothetical protein PQJ46_05980 [Spirochaetales bacterium]|nr:hypothetical protein [Spirochaetales bacterium]
MAKRFKGGMHGRVVKYHFKHPGMDFFFQWVLGMANNGGSTVGECFSTAARIEDGNPASWTENWNNLAIITEKKAKKSLEM